MRSRLTRLEKATGALNGGRCPVCAGCDGRGFNARIWFQDGDEPPVLPGAGNSPFYDDDGFCVRCGARARDIVICFSGIGSEKPPPATAPCRRRRPRGNMPRAVKRRLATLASGR